MKRRVAQSMRRTARALIAKSNKLDPPATESPAQQGLRLVNDSIRRIARDVAHDKERARIDAEYYEQMATLGIHVAPKLRPL